MANIECNDNNLIKTIQESVRTEIITSENGREYTTRSVHQLPSAEDVAFEVELLRRSRLRAEEQQIKELLLKDEEQQRRTEERKVPEPRVIEMNSLAGILDFLATWTPDEFSVQPEIIHVSSYDEVSVTSKLLRSGQRITFCTAKCPNIPDASFAAGKYYDQEQMVIALQALFVRTEVVETLLKVIGRTKDIISAEHMDDGTSQSVEIKSGIASSAEVKLPSAVVLNPFRTFLEIDQPESIFILRTRKRGDGPEFSLFLADGGLWKIKAIRLIKEFFNSNNVVLPVIG